MKIIAFACCHISREDTQIVFFEKAMSLQPVRKLFQQIIDNDYDLVVNCGDLFEPYYEDMNTTIALVPELREMAAKYGTKLIHIKGNHDRTNGMESYTHDDILFTHGHLNIVKFEGRTKQEYHDALMKLYGNQPYKCVFGHTHIAESGPNGGFPVALGSVLENKSYLEIDDGAPTLKYVSSFEPSA